MKSSFVCVFALSLALVSFVRVEALPVTSEYQVGIDDVLQINVLQPDTLSSTVTVSPDGFIAFPYIGEVQVQGLTLKQIKQEIESRLADGFMKYPLVTVFLQESRSLKFFIYGDIAKPGAYTLEKNVSVLQAIALSGGFTRFNSSSRVAILRPFENTKLGFQTIEVDIRAAMRGFSSANPRLQADDIVMVSQGTFFVYGEVVNPGAYPLEEGMTVLKAISVAGGFTTFGAASRVKVLRPKEGTAEYHTLPLQMAAFTAKPVDSYQEVDVELQSIAEQKNIKDIFLKPSDIVTVGRGDFYVYGEVNRPGVYPLVEGMTVLKAISVAGGFTKFGSGGTVRVLRPLADGSGYENIDVNIKRIVQGDARSDIALEPHDTVTVLEGVF